MQNKKPYQWIAWIGTFMLISAALLAAFNIYPYYIFAFIFANTVWILIGVLWNEKSLIIMNIGLTVIYVAGLIL